MHKKLKRINLFYVSLVLFLLSSMALVINIYQIPENIQIFENETRSLKINFPFSLQVSEKDEILEFASSNNYFGNSFDISSNQLGDTSISVSLLGKIPVKEIKVNVVPECKVIPGGQSIGVKMNIRGVLVVGMEEIVTENGQSINPSLEGGLQIGDLILEINGIPVQSSSHVQNIINDSQSQLSIKVKRKDVIYSYIVHPVYSSIDQSYRIGLWVRDKTAGVGTLTYYNVDNASFGALGHAITDIDTGILLNVDKGEILNSKVLSVQQGKSGIPGEIKGIFYEADKPIGFLYLNTEFGIFGDMYSTEAFNHVNHQPLDIGYQKDIKKGPAYILTTLEDNKIEKFEILIEKINYQSSPDTKSMVIRVTDKRLLQKSGGIVQGMSGSPIIQDGKLVGAVTHVFVNDPSKGYGLFIEWMLHAAGSR